MSLEAWAGMEVAALEVVHPISLQPMIHRLGPMDLPTTYPGNDDAPRGIKQTLFDMETNN